MTEFDVSEPRDQALGILYQTDRTGDPGDLSLVSSRVRTLVSGVLANGEELDEAIGRASDHWSVERMPVVDRAILRLGLYELREVPETPPAVVINEAVRLAKTYSTQRSGMFVNGVLSALYEEEASPGGHSRSTGV